MSNLSLELDLIAAKLDAKGQGVACGGGWISPRAKCSKDKAKTTSKENLAKTTERRKKMHGLKADVEAAARQGGLISKLKDMPELDRARELKALKKSGEMFAETAKRKKKGTSERRILEQTSKSLSEVVKSFESKPEKSLKDLFAEADRIGSKYQEPGEPASISAKRAAKRIFKESGYDQVSDIASGKVRRIPDRSKASLKARERPTSVRGVSIDSLLLDLELLKYSRV